MRVAFLWNNFSGYYNACMKELANRGAEIFVCHEAGTTQAPYDQEQFAWIKNRRSWRTGRELSSLEHDVHEFRPDILIFASWNKPTYRSIAKSFAGKAFRVMGMDNCWRGTMKQRLGSLIAPFYVRPLADAVWLPGERQAEFARRLGFEQRVTMRGSLTCDHKLFSQEYLKRLNEQRSLPKGFLYVSRFSPEKGLDTLVRAYEQYRKMTPDPWPLVCCGAGPLESLLTDREGIQIEGFVQPQDLPKVLASAGCFILPSTLEQWSIVVHEAASSGLPIIASDSVGAAVHLVQPNYNGYIFGSGDADNLAGLMRRVSCADPVKLEAMSQASYLLSQQYSPTLWADMLINSYNFLFLKQAARVDVPAVPISVP